MSSEQFELTEDDLEGVLEGLYSSLDVLARKAKAQPDSEEVKHWITRSRGTLVEARQLVETMEREARKAPVTYR